jgi:hypothetical protein
MPRKLRPLSPYEDLLELCAKRSYVVQLDWGQEGWTLDIFAADVLVARGTSTKDPPDAWRECAAHAAAGLSRSGRAKP